MPPPGQAEQARRDPLSLVGRRLLVDPEHAVAVSHTPASQDVALRAAREGIVLLKNEGRLLPLPRDLGSVAVVGPNADDARNQLGDYTAGTVLQDVTTVLEGIRGLVSPATRITHVRGCDVIGDDGESVVEQVTRGASDTCEVPMLEIAKVCDPQFGGSNGVSVTLTGTDHPGAGDTGDDLIDAKLFQLVSDHTGGALNIEQEFRIGMNVAPPCGDLVVKLRKAIDRRHRYFPLNEQGARLPNFYAKINSRWIQWTNAHPVRRLSYCRPAGDQACEALLSEVLQAGINHHQTGTL